VLGIPLGLAVFGGVYRIAGGDADLITMPPAWQLALVPAATALAVALAAAIPARRATGIRVAEALRFL
jgi:ABC-type lipoprotein release transport system permease subunit